jgi:AcrR family transcriptional regulator
MPACGSLVGYFPSKRAFFAAIVEEEGAKLLRASTPDLSLPPFDQIKAGLAARPDRSSSLRHNATAFASWVTASPGPEAFAKTLPRLLRVLAAG